MSPLATTLRPPEPRHAGMAEKLHRLMERLSNPHLPNQQVALGQVVDELDATGTGLCLLLFTLIALIPGVAPLFGLALSAVALGMVLGHTQPFLPQRLRRWRMDSRRLHRGLQRLAPAIVWLERWLRPRAAHLLGGPANRLTGLAGLINGVLIVLPIPFGNIAPAIALLILSLGLTARDGLAVGVGLLATVVALAVDLGMIALGYTAIVNLIENLS